jgi:hypothetical protein
VQALALPYHRTDFLHQNERLRKSLGFREATYSGNQLRTLDLYGTRKPRSRLERPRLGMFHGQLWAQATQWPDICSCSYIPRLRLAGRSSSVGPSKPSAPSLYLEQPSTQNSNLPNQKLTRRRHKQPVNCALVNTDFTSDFGPWSQRAVIRFREC